MARLVIKKAHGPVVVDKESHICMCGLSKKQPYCDDSHKKTLDEEQATYFYNDDGRFKVEEIRAANDVCKCGSNGSCDNCTHK